ncbi:MAG: DUF6198 family protein [Clostridia bacterium]|nr:DUF6198 family protein [Clostridia bacterium]
MKRKKRIKTRRFPTELAWFLGLVILALGTAMMEKAAFGMSMVVAPAYLLHLKISKFIPAYTFGMSEYMLQAVLLLALVAITRKVKKGYFFSFVTAMIYGFLLDTWMKAPMFSFQATMFSRVCCYILGMGVCAVGVAFLFRTYISPEAYELFVKELAQKLHLPAGKMKMIYDCTSCVIAIALSFAFFGKLVGVHWGTIVCALVNGWLIEDAGKWMDKHFIFYDALKLRGLFDS